MLNLKLFYLRWRFILRDYWYWNKPTILSRLTLVLLFLSMIAIMFASIYIYESVGTYDYGAIFLLIVIICQYKILDFVSESTDKFINSYYDDHIAEIHRDMKNVEKWKEILLSELDLPMNSSNDDIRRKISDMNENEQIQFYNKMVELNKQFDMFWLPQEKIKEDDKK